MASEAIIAQQIVDSTTDSRTIIVGAGMVWDNANKRLGINTPSPASCLHVTPNTAASVGVRISGAASQSGNLQEWRNSSGSILASVSATGEVLINATSARIFRAQANQAGYSNQAVTINDFATLTSILENLASNLAYGVQLSGDTFARIGFGLDAGTPFFGMGPGVSVRDAFIFREGSGVLAQRNGGNAQALKIYGTYTNTSNYVRASLSSSATTITLAGETAGTGADNIDVEIYPAGIGGVKIANGSAQKIGLWGASPVVQPTAIANATSEADAVTKLNDLLAKLRTIGVIAT